MTRRVPTTLVVLLVAGLLLVSWLTRPTSRADALKVHASKPVEQPAVVPAVQTDAENSPAVADDTDASDPAEPADIVPAGPSPHHRSLAASTGPEVGPGLTPNAVLQNMRSVIRDYSARLGGNPFGNNREITAKLNGGNQKQVVFLKPEDGMRLNDRGELVDNWGTPFFFHQISGTEMEIHSAGPDRKMWTPDDLVIK